MRLRKILSLLLSAVMLCLSFQANCLSIYATTLSAVEPTTDSDGYYLIGNAQNYIWFADSVNSGNTSINAKLIADIDFSNSTFTAIGTSSNPYSGTFDGCGYTITVNQSDSSDIAPFGKIGNCTIKNIIVKGTINTDEKFAAGIAMQLLSDKTANIESCISAVTIASSISGDGTHGGIIGVADGTVNINNCAFIGTMTGQDTDSCGGLVGWTSGSSNINNCYVAADFSQISSTKGNTFSRNQNQVKLNNCYYLNELNSTKSSAIQKTAEQFASGEVCFFLNKKVTDGSQAWYQTLGTDAYPQLSGKTVYYGFEQGKKVYSNTDISCTSHSYVNGMCEFCDEYEVPTLKNGAYQLSNYGNLLWFAQYVDSGNITANAILTADITANENLLNDDGSVSDVPAYIWNSISKDTTSSSCYQGTFDGNGHIISGLYCYYTNDYYGLFARLNGTIKNLGIIDSYFGGRGGYHIGTFTGLGYDNSIIENCFSSTSIVGSMYCGGLVGVTYGKIKNCYYIGKITASTKYSNVIASDYYNQGTLENCYYSDECGLTSSRATEKSADEFANGDVCYALQSSEDNLVWGQNLSSESSLPVLTSDEAFRVYRVTAVKDDTSSSYYSNSNFTLPVDDNGYWTDESGEVLYLPVNLTKDITITFKQFVSVLGDVDVNGKIERADAAVVLKHISDISLISDESKLMIADVNRDGVVDMSDVVEIIKKADSQAD